jgi:hypothetical protein
MTRPPRIAAQGDRRSTANRPLAERQNRSQGLRPEVARIVEALARAAARRDYRRAIEAAATPEARGPIR